MNEIIKILAQSSWALAHDVWFQGLSESDRKIVIKNRKQQKKKLEARMKQQQRRQV